MNYKLQDLIDLEAFQDIQDRLNEIYSFPSAIIDNGGTILTVTGWQDVCTQFHRKNKDCEQDCIQSDQYILSHLREANPAVSYRCPRGLVDNATPIIIDSIHYGNFFTGQFFFEKPDREFFRMQAQKYGFNEDAYLEAVEKVPIWTQEQLNSYLFIIQGLLAIISASGLSKLKDSETRKQIEASEERHRSILQRAMDGICWVDMSGRLREVNEAYCRITGYNARELLGMHLSELEAAESPYQTAAHIQKIIHQGEDRFESRHRRKDKTIFDVEVSVQYRSNEGGQMLAFIRDITERKRAVEELEKSEQAARRLARENELIAEVGRIINSTLNIEEVYQVFSQKVQEVIPFDRIAVNTINLQDYTRTITYVSGERFSGNRLGEVHSLVGTGLEQAMRSKSSLLVSGRNREDMIRNLPGLISHELGAQSTMLIPLIYKDEVIGALVIHSAARDAYSVYDLHLAERVGSQIAGAVVNTKLYLEWKQAEQALQESEKAARRLAQESELIAEIGQIISSTLNIEDVYERFAEKARQLIPFDRIALNSINMKDNTRTTLYVKGEKYADDCTGEILSLAGTRTEQVVQTRSSLIFNSKNREEMIRKFPGILSIKFGAQSTIITPLISKDAVIGSMAFHSAEIDAYAEHHLLLAERIGSQIAGAIANARLFLEHKKAEEERQILSERLQRAEKMEALGKLAGGVAHDLNNVLGVLSGYSELLVEGLAQDSPLRQYAANILKSSGKGAAIIEDLLTLARRGVVVEKVVDFNSIVANLLTTPEFGNLQSHHPLVNFKADLEKNLLLTKGSPVHLEKTVLNLFSNAAEAIAVQGEVKIQTENRYLDHAVQGYDTVKEGDYVVVTVSDSGRGIPAADLSNIFEPFYTKKSMGRSGTGLGLAIVWGTVKDHKGYIDVRSREGQGTTFTLYFPVTREKASDAKQKTPPEQYMGRGEAVLVVDDVPEQRQVAATLLIRLGYQVNTAAGGEEAVEYLKINKANILILDMIMEPGIDGLETYKRVLEINPHQKAIIVSGFSQTELVKEAQELGAGAYVKKPYLMEKVGMALRAELDRGI